jgi:hypothetical protein
MSKRYPMVMSQKEVLQLLKEGVYYLDETGDGPARLLRGGREVTKVYLDNGNGRGGGGRAWVRLYWNGRRKQIMFAKLVWMAHTRRVVPTGFEIHHRDLDRRNDRWGNLVCVHELDHRKFHGQGAELPLPDTEDIPF